ncbi:MAG: YbaB/EbfC family nucleoid-associated protein [Chlamydiales bacterium]|nr:YbaB/EbfC family nucleoid-associated protein [Chlamydiales bacterium]NCF70161.1 YbaB/EbfC family nucleoid-associated protein [Chlamydiales bacterium]
MGSGFSKRKKQAKQLQQQFLEMQEELKNKEVVGSAGSGLVEITMNGEHEVKKVSIKTECIDPEDPEGLEDLVQAAFNDANKKLGDQGMPNMPDMDINSLLGGLGGGASPF